MKKKNNGKNRISFCSIIERGVLLIVLLLQLLLLRDVPVVDSFGRRYPTPIPNNSLLLQSQSQSQSQSALYLSYNRNKSLQQRRRERLCIDNNNNCFYQTTRSTLLVMSSTNENDEEVNNDREEERDEDDNDDEEEDDEESRISDFVDTVLDEGGEEWDRYLDTATLKKLTIPQLKQQLRLRGKKVSGKKQELIARLLSSTTTTNNRKEDAEKNAATTTTTTTTTEDKKTSTSSQQQQQQQSSTTTKPTKTKAEEVVNKEQQTQTGGKDYIDVEAYLDDDEKGKDVKTSLPLESSKRPDKEWDAIANTPSTNTEVWGKDNSDVIMVEDYEGRSPVVDGLSRTMIDYRGSNQTFVSTYVVASRDAMKPFLAGGSRNRNKTDGAVTNAYMMNDPLERLKEIQAKREQSDKRPVRLGDDDALDESGDETGIYKDALHREFSDWGEYTVTGAQLSADEVQGVLILSDVYGPFTDATKALAEKIAFECQPVVCMVPDLFRDKPWKEEVDVDNNPSGQNKEGQDYEEWRTQNCDELRVSIDIRAAASVLREQYGVSSIVVWGTCFGGGRALEIGASYVPDGKIHDVDGVTIGPPPVLPEVVVAWYPTRYNAKFLFGPERYSMLQLSEPADHSRSFAVMGIFAGNDHLYGASPEDAEELKALLGHDERIKDHLIKIFPDQEHGFAHAALGGTGTKQTTEQDDDAHEQSRFVDDEFGGSGRVTINDGDADVACLLSTAFMETYSRKFLPTTGSPVSNDAEEAQWNAESTMTMHMKKISLADNAVERRDVRQEMNDSLDNHKDLPLQGGYIDPEDEEQQDELLEALRAMQDPDSFESSPELQITDEDNLETAYAKLLAGNEDFQIF